MIKSVGQVYWIRSCMVGHDELLFKYIINTITIGNNSNNTHTELPIGATGVSKCLFTVNYTVIIVQDLRTLWSDIKKTN